MYGPHYQLLGDCNQDTWCTVPAKNVLVEVDFRRVEGVTLIYARQRRFKKILGQVGELSMLFMVIERFRDNDMLPIYKRVRDKGRGLPDGLHYVNSWVEPNFARCFQLM